MADWDINVPAANIQTSAERFIAETPSDRYTVIVDSERWVDDSYKGKGCATS